MLLVVVAAVIAVVVAAATTTTPVDGNSGTRKEPSTSAPLPDAVNAVVVVAAAVVVVADAVVVAADPAVAVAAYTNSSSGIAVGTPARGLATAFSPATVAAVAAAAAVFGVFGVADFVVIVVVMTGSATARSHQPPLMEPRAASRWCGGGGCCFSG